MDDFKRDIYYKLLETLQAEDVIFLLGPRKTGKTYALDQLKRDFPKRFVKYDFKSLPDTESAKVVNEIVKNIKSGIEITYLLDEATYMFFPETEIAKIAAAYTEAEVNRTPIRTKIIFAGSQSIALESWGRGAFCHRAVFMPLDFLSYAEWLIFKENMESSEDSYLKFLVGTSEFYRFPSVEEYLCACLDETVKSNAKSENYIYGNDCELVSVDTLLDILYLTLFSLHDRVSAENFFRENSFANKVKFLSTQIENMEPLTTKETRDLIASSIISRYDHVRATDLKTVKQSFAFLIRSGLITATPISDELYCSVNVQKELENPNGIYKDKKALFQNVNFTIRYPMFYVEILKDILGDKVKTDLDHMSIGSITECYVRGLLPSKGSFEYHNKHGEEIDYLNSLTRQAIEITVSNKDVQKDTCLSLLTKYDGFHKILLSKNIKDIKEDVTVIPYYNFIHSLTNTERSKDRGITQEEENDLQIDVS